MTLKRNLQEDKIIYNQYIDKKKVLQIIKICEENSIYYNVYTNKTIIADGLRYNVLYYYKENLKKEDQKKTHITLVENIENYIKEMNEDEKIMKIFICDKNKTVFNSIVRKFSVTEDIDILEKTKDKKRIIVINKNDLLNKLDISKIKDNNIIYTNTLNYEGIESLTSKIKEMFNMELLDVKDFNYVSNVEQLNRLYDAKKSLEDVEKGLNNNLPIDMIEIDLKNIWTILGEIIGETYTDELLDNLFRDFCVGK